VYAGLIFVASMVPVDPRVSVGHLDKVVHLCEYLLFAWLLVQAIRTSRVPRDMRSMSGTESPKSLRDFWGPEREYLLWAWIYATSYGLLIELLQGLVPWRSADLADALANALGAALGVWVGQRTSVHSPSSMVHSQDLS